MRFSILLDNCRYRQNEMKENQGRIVGKAYFYIDPQKFCNVVKWRISDMRNQIDNSLKSVSPEMDGTRECDLTVIIRNLTTRATYAHGVQNHLQLWKWIKFSILFAIFWHVTYATRSWLTMRTRRKSKEARIACKDSMLR
jgi:hypothetical protein